MKLIVNISSVSPPVTGIGYYCSHLVQALNAHPEVEDIWGFDLAGWHPRSRLMTRVASQMQGAPGGRQGTPLARYTLNLKAFARNIPGARNLKRRLLETRFVQKSDHLRDYLYWEPNYLLFPFHGRRVTTIHDLSHVHYPQYHPKDRVKALTRYLASSVARSDHVIAVSEFTREQVQEVFGLSASQISVVPPGVSEAFRRAYTGSEKEAVRKKYAVPSRFVLSVGTMEPRKNLLGLIRAFEQLPESTQQAFPLVFVGAKGWLSEEIEHRVAALVARRRAFRLGYVAAEDLPVLYAAASVFAYPSFYEGFGMPVAEAMAAGTAVVTSNVASMPEVAGDAAQLVSPEDIDSIRHGLETVLEDEAYRTSLAQAGRVRAQQFTWQASCAKLMAAFQQITDQTMIRQRA